MRRKLEIMAPAGNFEALSAAIQGGADSVYFGVGELNMRSHSANNFSAADLPEIVDICCRNGVKSYLTLNIVLYDDDLDRARRTLDMAKSAGVTAVIASDISAILYARSIGMEVHISTQANITNIEAVRFYSRFADVVVLARELNLNQVSSIRDRIESENICGPSGRRVEIEMFCHGALCMAVSGKCYLSLHEYNHSANRGSCFQICRRGYRVTDLETGRELEVDNKYIMSPKDLCTLEFMDKMAQAGVSLFKIEGRARSAEYVKKVTCAYRKAADAIENGTFSSEMAAELKNEVAEVFNRGFWDGYYQGARLGEWSKVYGSNATKKKTYVGKINNYFSNISVAEISVEAMPLRRGSHIMVIGPTTGVVEFDVTEIRVDLEECSEAPQGVACSVPSPQRVRRADKVYLFE